MSYRFIYTQEYLRPLRAVLVDIRYDKDYPTVAENDLFYCIEDSSGSLAGVLILTVDNSLQSCIEKFHKTRVPFKQFKNEINVSIQDFITSNNWQDNFIFYTPEIHQGLEITPSMTLPPNILYGFNGNMAFSARPFSNPDVLAAIASVGEFGVMRCPGNNGNIWDWVTGKNNGTDGNASTLYDFYALYLDRGCDILFVVNMCTHTLEDQLDMLAAAEALGIPIKYVELGNEINVIGSDGHPFYPTAELYANACAIWIAAIKAIYPDVLICACGGKAEWTNTVIEIANPDAIAWHVKTFISNFWNGSAINYAAIYEDIKNDWIESGFDLVPCAKWPTEFNYDYEDDNVLPDNIAQAVTLYMLQQLPAFISLNAGTKLMCVRTIEGLKQGAFLIKTNTITERATGFAMQEFIASLNA